MSISITKYDNWRNLTTDQIKFQYMVEYPKLRPSAGPVFPRQKDFIKAVRLAKPMRITKAIDNRIDYRSQSGSIQSLKSLVATYRYPRDVDRIIQGYRTNSPMPYPLVYESNDGYLRVIGGNTRMDVAFILGIQPKALIVKEP